ncbi:hypothetical protein Tco_0465096 [Tanacetum coccineum]
MYARALIEVLTANALLDSLVVAISLPNGKGHTLETIEIEYEWRPPRCDNCKIFDHTDTRCPKRVDVIKPVGSNKPSTSGDNEEGFVEVKTRKKKGKKMMKNEGSKGGSNAASFSGTTMGREKMPSPSCAKLNLKHNRFERWDDVKVQEDDSLWKHFQRSKKISSQEDDKDEQSEVEEYPPYDTTGISSTGGGFSLEDDDLDCYDGYEAKIYNLSRKSRAFCDNYDIRLNSRVRKFVVLVSSVAGFVFFSPSTDLEVHLNSEASFKLKRFGWKFPLNSLQFSDLGCKTGDSGSECLKFCWYVFQVLRFSLRSISICINILFFITLIRDNDGLSVGESGARKADLVSCMNCDRSSSFTFVDGSAFPDSLFVPEFVWAVFNPSLADWV